MWGGWVWADVDWFDFVCLILGFGVGWVCLPRFDCGFLVWVGLPLRFSCGFDFDVGLV